MNKVSITISTLLLIVINAVSQTVTIYTQGTSQSIPNNFKPGIQMVPKTPSGTNDFLNNDIDHSALRAFSIESAMNHWTVSSINDVMAELENQKVNILIADSRCDKLILPIFKMPIWLSSSTDTTSLSGGFKVFNAMPPADYNVWNTLMDSIVNKINNQWGLDPYYEFWNEPDGEYWRGTTDEYFELFKNTYFAVKTNHPNAKFGGPTVGGFIAQFTPTLPSGYLTNTQLDSTIIGTVIDSCVSWNAHLDFISWHKFEPNLHNIEVQINYLNQKLTNSGHGIVPYIVSEWNMPNQLRESALDQSFMINHVLASIENNIDNQLVASWQDFSEDAVEYVDTSEFHRSYGLVSWNDLHKPSWKALQLLNKLYGNLLEVDNSDYKNLSVTSSYNNDTLKVLVSNYSFPSFEQAILSLYYDFQYNSNDIANAGYTPSMLDSIFQGLIILTGTDPLTNAINSVIPVYQQAENLFNNGRNINIKIPNIVGSHSGTEILIDSTHNNIIYQYDSLINNGYTRASAVSYLYPNHTFDIENISMLDSTYSFHLQANGVAFLQFYIPEIVLSVQENSIKTTNHLLFPNPTSDNFTIKIGENYNELKVYIYNNNGSLVSSHINKTQVDISNLASGIYFVKITIDGKIETNKIIKIE